ncbi:MAG TPA: FecR domain-containing protein [Allosphingosinicella sp.]
MPWPFKSAQERLDDDAALWVSRMHGGDAEQHRPGFEQWRRKPANRLAYEEALVSLGEGRHLHDSPMARSRSLPELRRRRLPVSYALAGAVVAAAIAVLFLASAYVPPELRPGRGVGSYASGDRSTRLVNLADGSKMLLGRGASADAALTDTVRLITLRGGTGRFSVSHEPRPFRVAAGEALVTAHGTVFDVRLAHGRTIVSLIEGSVDVSYPTGSGGSDRRTRITRLKPGQQIVVGTPHLAAPSTSAMARKPAPAAPAMLLFDDTKLADAVAEANRHSGGRIRLAGPSIGALRITGAFRAGDADAFAEGLAAAFSLQLERRPDGVLILYSKPPPHRDP